LAAADTVTIWFDRVAFGATLRGPYRPKQDYDSIRLRSGTLFHSMANSLNAHDFDMREDPRVLHVAAVLRGPSLVAMFDDAIWWKCGVAKLLADAFNEKSVQTERTRAGSIRCQIPRPMRSFAREAASFLSISVKSRVCGSAQWG
jgi:hypothetical protein